LILSRKLIGLNQGFKEKRIISFHLQRTSGVFLTVLEVEGDSLTGRSIEGSSEEFEGVHGYSRIRRFKEHQIQRLSEVWGSVCIGVE